MNEILIIKENTNKGLLDVITLTNDQAEITIISYGAGLYQYKYQNQNIIIKPKTISDYNDDDSYYGKTIGRTSGRLVTPSFKIDDKTYKIDAFGSLNTQLHGGRHGFSTKNFKVFHIEKTDTHVLVTLQYISKDLEEGFPGKLTLDVTYQLNLDGSLLIKHEAISTKDTLCNITNHAYFNLNQNDKTINDHQVSINASTYLDIDDNYMIKGKKDVIGTPFDFSKTTTFKKQIDLMKNTSFKGFDHTLFLDDSNITSPKATIFEPKSKIGLNLYTSYPAVVLYTHNFPAHIDLEGPFEKEAFHSSFTLECQYEPGGIHHSYLNQAILRKNEKYDHFIKFEPYKKN